ncbi:MAG: hypothetical protein FWF95_08100, partial [Syntrophorhabdaceae bacterium]|nr:hypothetical protein [Syntrophorhabdaceae bacterium]
MDDNIKKELLERGADIIRFVDISCFSKEQTLGFEKAVLFCMALSKKYIIDTHSGLPVDINNDEFLKKEHKVEELADWLAGYIRQKGFRAHSQSEKNNLKNGYVEQAYINLELQQGISILPQKSIARVAGLGFIGKSNLLITEDYGSALCICSVLTDVPVITENQPIIQSMCGACEACIENCPANAICGSEWTISGRRDDIIDVSK